MTTNFFYKYFFQKTRFFQLSYYLYIEINIYKMGDSYGKVVKQYEKKGRDKFEKLCNMLFLQFEETPNRYDNFDAVVYKNGKKYLVEIKDRNFKYDYETIMLEKEKYELLKNSIESEKANGAFYISFFENDAYTYYLPTDMNEKEYDIACNKKTYISNEKGTKKVYLINKNKMNHYDISANNRTDC